MKTLVLIFLLIPFTTFAQVTENFEDGNITQNPEWFGNVNKFIVNSSKQLQLHDTVAGIAYLSVKQSVVYPMEWCVWVKLGFSPSANNNLRIYLMSDKKVLNEPLNGYYLQLGESGSQDALELFRQDSTKEVSVCRGKDGTLAKAFQIRIKVLRDGKGHWQLFADQSGGHYFQKEAEGDDNTYNSSSYFGFYCKYTKSNKTKMYFDDIYLGPQIIDTVAPKIMSLKVTSDSTLLLNFSESVDTISVQDIAHYKANPSCGKILDIEPSIEGKSAILFFTNHFVSGAINWLRVSGIKDLSGNVMKPDSLSFVFYRPKPNDLVINEIMADPNPPVNLPDYEYLELYNRTDFDIDMSGWQIQTGIHKKTIDTLVLKAKSYLIVSGTKGASSFEPFGKVFAFSSFNLNNRGETVSVRDAGGQLISQVSYSEDWYRDDAKSKGGWSLEQINPANYCSGRENWKVSENPKGGTPGAQNSVYDDQIFSPKLNRFQISGQDSLDVFFNQKMDSNSICDRSLWQVTPDVGDPDEISFYDSIPEEGRLSFSVPFADGKQYVLHILKDLKNCAGIPMEKDTTMRFGFPQAAGKKDIIINEVLLNPFSGGVDYLELYNLSQKVIDLNKIKLGYIRESSSDTVFYDISTNQNLMFPSTYLVLTSSPEIVKQQYEVLAPDNFLKMERFPNFNSQEGGILIENQSGKILDAFNYSDAMQFQLLKETKGVSLERTRFDRKTDDPKNWHSAAESAGYGTPGYRNSQFEPDTAFSNSIHINPAIFSPDGDGYQDKLQIKYNFSAPGNTIRVEVFNANGYLIRHLIQHEYLGTNGSLFWDGKSDDGTLVSPGIYILYFQLFDLQGHVRKYKKAVVVAYKHR